MTAILPIGAWLTKGSSPFQTDAVGQEHSRFQWTVSDVALWTAVVAILIGFLLRVDFDKWRHALRLSSLVSVLFSTLVIACTSLVTWVVMVSRGWLAVRIGCILIIWLLCTELLVLCEQWRSNAGIGWSGRMFNEYAFVTFSVVVTASLACLPFQLRRGSRTSTNFRKSAWCRAR